MQLCWWSACALFPPPPLPSTVDYGAISNCWKNLRCSVQTELVVENSPNLLATRMCALTCFGRQVVVTDDGAIRTSCLKLRPGPSKAIPGALVCRRLSKVLKAGKSPKPCTPINLPIGLKAPGVGGTPLAEITAEAINLCCRCPEGMLWGSGLGFRVPPPPRPSPQ